MCGIDNVLWDKLRVLVMCKENQANSHITSLLYAPKLHMQYLYNKSIKGGNVIKKPIKANDPKEGSTVHSVGSTNKLTGAMGAHW